MCSVSVVGPGKQVACSTVPGTKASCVGEAKEQWLSAVMCTTVMCTREQQDGQAVCTQLPSHSVKNSGSQV